MATLLRELRALRGVASWRPRADCHDIILQLDTDIVARSSFVRLVPLAAQSLLPLIRHKSHKKGNNRLLSPIVPIFNFPIYSPPYSTVGASLLPGTSRYPEER